MKKRLSSTFFLLAIVMLISPIWTKVSAYPDDAINVHYSMKGKVIVLDAGHGGSDTGAIGPNKLTEKNVTLFIARELRDLLSTAGATVIMTRTTDKDVAYPGASSVEELQARVIIANKAHADLFISIHTDAFSEYVNGTTTYFFPSADSSLANFVQNSMVKELQLNNRGIKSNDYYVLKHTTMPAILTEAAFISNPKEERLLNSRIFDKKVALGIYNGIKNYFSSDRSA